MTVTDRLGGARSSLAYKAPCKVATTANITLSGEQTIDGVAVVAGDRVLVKNQTAGAENGIYEVAAKTWARAADVNSSRDVTQGTRVLVNGGTLGSGVWELTTSGTIVLGATSLSYTSLGSASAHTATRTTLKALDPNTVASAYLLESGRDGLFVWQSGDYSTQVTADTQEGIYIASDHVASTSGAWVRVHSNVMEPRWFGAATDGTSDTTDAMQALVDFTDAVNGTLTSAVILLDQDYTINKTFFLGNNTFIRSPGTLRIISDSSFTERTADGGAWSDEAVILTKSANLNTAYGTGNPYLDTFTLNFYGVKVYFNRTDASAPQYPMRLTGLRDSTFDLEFEGTCSPNSLEINPPDFYFNNKDTEITGTYRLDSGAAGAGGTGGFWIRDINLGGSGPDYATERLRIHDLYAYKSHGADDVIALFNSTTGYMRDIHVENVIVEGVGCIGFALLNNADVAEENWTFNISNLTVVVTDLPTGQGVVKLENSTCIIDGLFVHLYGVTDVAADNQRGIVSFQLDGRALPQVNNARLVSYGTFAGVNPPDAFYGDMHLSDSYCGVDGSGDEWRRGAQVNLTGTIRNCVFTGCATHAINRCRDIRGSEMHGKIQDFAHFDGRVYWDTSKQDTAFSSTITTNPSYAYSDCPDVTIDAVVVQSGSSATRVVNLDTGTSKVCRVKYILDHTGETAPSSSDVIDNPIEVSTMLINGATTTLSDLRVVNGLTYDGTNFDVTGNIVVSGTVDGRDVAADGTKLDGIATGAEVNTVEKVGTPANNQVCVWTGDGTIEGDADLEWNGTLLSVGSGTTGQINSPTFKLPNAFTVATLPTTTAGSICRVSDASAPSVGSTVSGGGAASALVWYNGSNWTVIGV